MTTSDAALSAADAATRRGRALATLGAALAVWRDLSVGRRQRIAEGAMVAMSGREPSDAADADHPGAAPACRR